MSLGRFEVARVQLAQLLDQRPDWEEVRFLLGECELASGNHTAAFEVWDQVSPESTYASLAAIRRAPLALEWGWFARAEEILHKALQHPGPHESEARELLGRILRFQGRMVEARALLRQESTRAPDLVRVLREYWMLEAEATPIERTRLMFVEAARSAPEDDRVLLGLANLNRLTGRLDEAKTQLDACLRIRPNDAPIWRSRLDWALAAGDADEAQRAIDQLPAEMFEPGEPFALEAWFAEQHSDRDGQRRALERLVERKPAAAGVLEKLAVIAAEDGRFDEVDRLRQWKEELDQARERYWRFFDLSDEQLEAQALELARLTEELGRHFEAIGWWTLVARRTPGDPEARQALARLRSVETLDEEKQALVAFRTRLGRRERRSRRDLSAARSGFTPRFEDVADQIGLSFTFHAGHSPLCQLPETMSGGIGLIDFDGDGWIDVYAIQGGPFPPDPMQPGTGDRLFRNRGDGSFEDVTTAAGLEGVAVGYGHGVTVGDIDNDGHPDLFITRWRSYQLLRNRGDGTFEDITDLWGLGGEQSWPTSAAFADLDGDGLLDLYVCHYLEWNPENPKICHDPDTGQVTYCNPGLLPAESDKLFRNEGDRFVDISAEAGIVQPDGRGLGVLACDLDGNGLLDLYVANDQTANFLLRNRGGMRFEEVGHLTGVAASGDGGYQAGMGVACGDFDGDGRPDLAVTNFYAEGTTFYRNLGHGLFADHTAAIGLLAPSRYLLGFGIAFFDFNNDGYLDLATANGMVTDSRPVYPYALPAQLFAGGPNRRLNDVTHEAGPPWTLPRVGRGLAVGDLDNDGRLDVLIVPQDGPLAVFQNQTRGGHFVTFLLEGVSSSRDAVGARITITHGGHRQVAWRVGGQSYLSAHDPRIHFGLGESDRMESVEVAWPSGRVDRHEDLKVNTGYLLREGATQPTPLTGFDH